MSQAKVDHLAIAVPSLAEALKKFSLLLGVEAGVVEELEEHGVRVAFFELENLKIELMEPLGDDSPISNFLKRNPRGGFHHMSLACKNIDEAAKRSGIEAISDKKRKGAKGANSKEVLFLDPKVLGILVELQQE